MIVDERKWHCDLLVDVIIEFCKIKAGHASQTIKVFEQIPRIPSPIFF